MSFRLDVVKKVVGKNREDLWSSSCRYISEEFYGFSVFDIVIFFFSLSGCTLFCSSSFGAVFKMRKKSLCFERLRTKAQTKRLFSFTFPKTSKCKNSLSQTFFQTWRIFCTLSECMTNKSKRFSWLFLKMSPFRVQREKVRHCQKRRWSKKLLRGPNEKYTHEDACKWHFKGRKRQPLTWKLAWKTVFYKTLHSYKRLCLASHYAALNYGQK